MPELLDLARKVADMAQPGEQVEAYVAWQRDTDVRVFEGEVEQFSSAESAGVGVRVIAGRKTGFAYVGQLDEAAGREALVEARDNASFATDDEYAGLAVPDGHEPVLLDLWREATSTTPASDKIGLALEVERLVRAADSRVAQVISADYGDALVESAIATSTGIAVTSRRTACNVSADALAADGDDKQEGFGYSVGRAPSELDVERAAQDAARRAVRLLGARKAKSARLTVVFEPRITATLLSILAGTLSGEEVAKGRSLFAGRIGEDVAVPGLTLVEDPTNPLAYGARVYDGEGLACRRVPLIDGGRLGAYLYDTTSARMVGATSTASAVRGGFKSTPGVGARALAVLPGELDLDAILAQIGDGFLVQMVTGVHSGVNAVSGDFSVGAEGLMIRGGAIAEPVREVTIASTIQRMLHGVLAVGNDLEWLPGIASGVTLAVGDVAMSGE